MSDILQFKRNAIHLGLCGKYKNLWDACSSKSELVRLALDGNGIEFMSDSIAFGWGLSRDYLMKEFGEFMNGAYRCQERGYTSEMYVGARGVVIVSSTLVLAAYCDGLELLVPEHMACKVYVCGGSRLRVEIRGRLELYVYGPDNDVAVDVANGGVVLRDDVQESQWSKSGCVRPVVG